MGLPGLSAPATELKSSETEAARIDVFIPASYSRLEDLSSHTYAGVMFLLIVFLNIFLGLWLESQGSELALHAVTVATWLVFFWVFFRADGVTRTEMACCLVFATLGELFLSEVWNLYAYRQGALPWFVPPGHVLLYLAGIQLSTRLGKNWWKIVPVLMTPINLYFWWSGRDTIGILFFTVFLVLLWREKRNRDLYVTMFILSLVMEIYGTAMGSWRWATVVPWFGLTSLNPPLCAGVFYCLLDALVVQVKRFKKSSPMAADPLLVKNLIS